MPSSWIWMKGITPTIPTQVMDPVGDDDQRPSVLDLIAEHDTNIQELASLVQEDPLYEPEKHDAIFLLRFLLSHKQNVKRASKAVKATLVFRKEYRLDERDIRHLVPHKIQDGEYGEMPFAKTDNLQNAWKTRSPEDAIVFTIPDPKRGVVAFLNIGNLKNDSKTAKKLTVDDVASVFILTSEWAHQWLDYVTRTTGRFTKSVRLIDFSNFSIFQNSREATKRDGKIMDMMEDIYPQLLQALFIYNAPNWIHSAWAIFRPIMPKRIIAKIDIIDPKNNQKEKEKLLAFLSDENMPVTMGGSNTTSPRDWESQ
ncbi:unnamed protein product [Cylindrotheca closterium]|uniref:CRAL-TRIO domain-containing protein n=1 Tax=Cylindrotheca closterium TaxID=2856 RepID=A0AAD2CI36_9STRA|nr:unnamed protein product [Cylindrotheca closterium]